MSESNSTSSTESEEERNLSLSNPSSSEAAESDEALCTHSEDDDENAKETPSSKGDRKRKRSKLKNEIETDSENYLSSPNLSSSEAESDEASCISSEDDDKFAKKTPSSAGDRKRKRSKLKNESEAGSENENSSNSSPSRMKVPRTSGFVYRLLGDNESYTSDLTPKDQFSSTSVETHVLTGSQYGSASKYISTCRTYQAVRTFLSKKYYTDFVKIAKIYLDQLNSGSVIDLTRYPNSYLESEGAFAYARKFKEVLITGTIPKSAYKIIYEGSEDRCPWREPRL